MEEKKQTILEWYREKHNYIDAPCGGQGTCGKCKVRFLENPPEPTEREKELLSAEEIAGQIRLACMTRMAEGSRFVPAAKMSEQEYIMVHEPAAGTYGIAIDVGTTTLVMRLVNLNTGKAIATVSGVNPQRMYGADVITRIKLANEGQLQLLCLEVKRALKDLFYLLLEEAKIVTSLIKKVVIVGNTTMLHILQGYSCEGLGTAPFSPVDLSMQKLTAGAYAKELPEDAKIIILPGISAFVGADIVAGMYYCDMDLKETTHMLVDVGTNGEMVLGNRHGFWVTSTAAGPVFEGGNISCGMPAVLGCITHMRLRKCEYSRQEEQALNVAVSKQQKKVKRVESWEYECLGEQTPQGICGSGLIDLTAGLYEAGIIDENGTLTEMYFEEGYPICQSTETTLRMLQSDIREIQMGKAAIRAGIELLSRKVTPENIYLAGAFGAQIDLKSAMGIGLFSESDIAKIKSVGNAALEGAQKFLLDEAGEARIKEMVSCAKEILLANEPEFEEYYIKYMQFEK